MLPTLAVDHDWVYISKLYRRGRGIRVGDVVSFKHPTFPSMGALKRVVGMPGDFVLRDTPGSEGGMMIQVWHFEYVDIEMLSLRWCGQDNEADGVVNVIGSGGSLLGHRRQLARVQGFEDIRTNTTGANQGKSYSKGIASHGHEVDGERVAKA